MAGSADDDQPRAPPRDEREIEEGEVVSGYHAGTGSDTDTDDEDARYYLQSSHDDDHWVRAGSERRGSSPARSFGSDNTLSDDDAAAHIGDAAGAVTVARAGEVPLPPVFPCGVCGREFRCSKAVHGHMRMHSMAAKEEKKVAAAAVGVSGGGASPVEEVGDSGSMSPAVVLTAIPKLLVDDTITPVQSVCSNNPVANGGSGSSSARSSVEPSATGQSMANNVVAAPAPPAAAPEQVSVAPPPTSQQQVLAAHQQPTAVASQHVHPLQRDYDGPPHTVVRTDLSIRRQAPAENNQGGFSCKECNRWFPTHQGLGGHVAGHKNRRIQAAALAAAEAGIDPEDHMALCRGGIRPAKSHACKVCGQEYPRGVSLGGHMRKHYNGKPIVPRKRLRLGLPELALAQPLQRAGPSMEAPIVVQPLASYQQERVEPVVEVAAQPPQAPLPAGSVRLFGVTITQQPKKEEEEEEEVVEEEAPVDESMNEQ